MLSISKNMETGIPKIDAQHRELCNRINAVIQAGAASVSKEETAKTLQFLSDYVIQHFHDEEQLQIASRYPDYQKHKQMHSEFIAKVKHMYNEFVVNGASPAFTLSLNQSVIDWLVKHIQYTDTAFGKFYNSQL